MMLSSDGFPRLTSSNHRLASPPTSAYNCVAWAAGDTRHWWQPGVFWPIDTTPEDYGVSALEGAFRALGYEICADSNLEAEVEKVALYGLTSFYTHAARQLANGKWTSKLGRAEDVEHDSPDDVAGGVYGEIFRLTQRRRAHE